MQGNLSLPRDGRGRERHIDMIIGKDETPRVVINTDKRKAIWQRESDRHTVFLLLMGIIRERDRPNV